MGEYFQCNAMGEYFQCNAMGGWTIFNAMGNGRPQCNIAQIVSLHLNYNLAQQVPNVGSIFSTKNIQFSEKKLQTTFHPQKM